MSVRARHILTFGLALALAFGPAVRALAQGAAFTGAEVVALGSAADGEIVTMEGEAIGDVLRADGAHVWVNVLSGGTAVGVWMPSDLVAPVERLGDYHTSGDVVRVSGTFNFACDVHGGDLDIHATGLRLIAGGSATDRPITPYKLVLAASLTAAAALQAVLYRRTRRRRD